MRRRTALILGRHSLLRRTIALAFAERGIDLVLAGATPADPSGADQQTAQRYGVRVSHLPTSPDAAAICARDFEAASRRHRGVDIVIVLGWQAGAAVDTAFGRCGLDAGADGAGTRVLAMALPHMVWSRWGRVICVVGAPKVVQSPAAPHASVGATPACGVTFNTIVTPAAASGGPADRPAAKRGRIRSPIAPPARDRRYADCRKVARLVVYLCSETAGAISNATLRL